MTERTIECRRCTCGGLAEPIDRLRPSGIGTTPLWICTTCKVEEPRERARTGGVRMKDATVTQLVEAVAQEPQPLRVTLGDIHQSGILIVVARGAEAEALHVWAERRSTRELRRC